LCCLSSAESKLLVYDYMDNDSLDRWLHGDALVAGGRPMSRAWSARARRWTGRRGSGTGWLSAPRGGCAMRATWQLATSVTVRRRHNSRPGSLWRRRRMVTTRRLLAVAAAARQRPAVRVQRRGA
jgi:hypothetical protein